MSALLLGYQITDLAFHNALPDKTAVHLSTRVGYNVKLNPAGVARGEMEVEVTDREREGEFFVRVTAVGLFRPQPGLPPETVHKDTFRTLFPYLRAAVSTVTAVAGIPAVLLPPIDPDGQDVVKFELRPGGAEAGK